MFKGSLTMAKKKAVKSSKSKEMVEDTKAVEMVEKNNDIIAVCSFKDCGVKYSAGDIYTGDNAKELRTKGLIA